MVSILSVSYHSPEFAELLVKSVIAKTKGEYEILIQNNGGELTEFTKRNCQHFENKQKQNQGHGQALDFLLTQASGDLILILDIDAHIILPNWDKLLQDEMDCNNYHALYAQGGQLKPIRPACVALRRSAIAEIPEFSMQAKNVKGAKFDVGILGYFQLLSAGLKIGLLPCTKTEYSNCWGEEYRLKKERFVFHHYYGTRFVDGLKTVIDGRTYQDFLKARENLFNQIPYGKQIVSNPRTDS